MKWSSNMQGVSIDAIRCWKLVLDRGQSGILYGPSAYFMKHPPKQFTDDQAYQSTEEFITGKNNKLPKISIELVSEINEIKL